MLVTITGKHVDITDDIRSYAQDKASKLPRYYNRINHIEMLVEQKEAARFGVEIIAAVEHSTNFVASGIGDDIFGCIDIAFHKLERQLSKKKERQRNNKHIPGGTHVEPSGTSSDLEEDIV